MSLKELKAYLASRVIQSQQVLLAADVDAHCKETTKSFEERKRRGGWRGEEGGEQQGMVGGWVGSESPTPLCYEGKQVVSIIATDAGQCSWGNSQTTFDSLLSQRKSDTAYC